MERDSKTICLFDVDGTLTLPRKRITSDMENMLTKLSSKVCVGLVGGSDITKISEQMGGFNALKKFDFVFSENGLVAFKQGEDYHKESILKYMGEEKLQELINFCMKYMSTLKLPVKRGNFIEFRDSLINICPVGRSCSQVEREQFAKYDQEHKIRDNFVVALKKEFPESGLKFAIGGQISIDVYPESWDKSYCLSFVQKEGFEKIYFFGDKTTEGGNDYEIFIDPRTISHSVTSPQDTQKLIQEIFFSSS